MSFSSYLFLAIIQILSAPAAQACSVCFANAQEADAKGINMAILSLLAVIACILVGFAAFFIALKKRANTQVVNSSTKYSSQKKIKGAYQ